MKNLLKLSLVAAGCVTSLSAMATPTITVYQSLAPNAFGSPSYAQYVINANTALYNGNSTGGTVGTPSYYSQVTGSLDVSQNIVTGFPSWNGQADPGTVFGAPFANELGNRLLNGLTINGNGTQFSISQLSFVMDSTDPANSLDFGFGAGSYNYNSDYWGVLFGGDGAWGGGDDTFITGGPNTQLVDGLVGRGSGNAWAVYDTSPGATRQDKLDLAVAALEAYGPFSVTGTYSLGSTTGSATTQFNAVPDGGSTAALLFGALALLGVGARRKA